MTSKLELGRFGGKLQKIPFACTISNISVPDHPLVFMNAAFCNLTGYDQSMIGQNCRFLQSDLENTEACAEIREALEQRQRTQVLLNNRRRDGSIFKNLLMLEPIGQYEGLPELVMGTQFDASASDAQEFLTSRSEMNNGRLARVTESLSSVRLERRRVAANSMVRIIQSWCILHSISPDSV